MARAGTPGRLALGCALALASGTAVSAEAGDADLREQADNGNAEALFELGAAHGAAEGVRQDLDLAAKLFGLTAAGGDARAQYRLIQLDGTGVAQDAAPADHRLVLASRSEGEVADLAKALQKGTMRELSARQLETARARVEAFVPERGPAQLPLPATHSSPLAAAVAAQLGRANCGTPDVVANDVGTVGVSGFVPKAAGAPAIGGAVQAAVAEQPLRLDPVEIEPALCDVVEFLDGARRLQPLKGLGLRNAQAPDVQEFGETRPRPPPDMNAEIESILGRFACADLAYDRGGNQSVTVFGFVASEGDLTTLEIELAQIVGVGEMRTAEVEVQPWPFCEVLLVVEPLRERNQQDRLGLALTMARSDMLEEGEDLKVNVTAPAYPAYLYLDYVQQDGLVVHVAHARAGDAPEAAGNRFVYDTGFVVEPPFGREMIMLTASPEPLFPVPRPGEAESVNAYLPELRRRVEELQAAQPALPLVASHVYVTTRPAGALP